jgi:hypothetical protein
MNKIALWYDESYIGNGKRYLCGREDGELEFVVIPPDKSYLSIENSPPRKLSSDFHHRVDKMVMFGGRRFYVRFDAKNLVWRVDTTKTQGFFCPEEELRQLL